MSDMVPTAGAAPPPRSPAEQKVEQIVALLSKTQRPQSEAQAAKSSDATADKAAAADTKLDAASPDEKKGLTTPLVERDPIIELLSRLQVAAGSLGDRDAGLALGINKLAEKAAQPGVVDQATFRTHVAYSLQDTEKVLGAGKIAAAPELRAEMMRLADTTPGLENSSMKALLASTRGIDDRGLVRDLRRASASMATMGPNQNDPAVNQVVETFENRVRLANRVATAPMPTEVAPIAADTIAERPAPSAPATERPRASEVSPDGGIREERRVAASPAGGLGSLPEKEGSAVATPGGMRSHPKTAMAQIMDNLRPSTPSAAPPWNPPVVRMGDRVSQFQQRLDQGKTDQLIQASEKSGVALMKSIETFANGPGASVLGKIDAAAKTEPGGAKAVMQEMQPGGRYAALRTEFDNALQSDRVFAAAYSQVEKTGAQHGKDRLALNADFDAKKLDVRQLDSRFQQADEAIGEAAERIPGRTPGKSAMDELGQRVAEMIGKAVQRVRSMFGRDAVPEPRPSASPSMAP